MILLDTSVLSVAFRRRPSSASPPRAAVLLRHWIEEGQPLALPGIVVQELLSGLRSEADFARLAREIEGLAMVTASHQDHLAAARIANSCRRIGVAASTVDCLIAAQTLAARARLFTLDEDFARMAPCCGLELVPVG